MHDPVGKSAPDDRWGTEAVRSAESTVDAARFKIYGYIKGVHAANLVAIGADVGLFARLGREPAGLQPDILAGALQLHPFYVQKWCEAACALELLDYTPTAGYRLAPGMEPLLGQADSIYDLGSLPQCHLLIAQDYARYPELFRTGGTKTYQQHDPHFFAGIAAATRNLSRVFLDAVMPKLPDLDARLQAGAHILDVGCGGGYAIVEFARKYPRSRCTGIDIEATSVQLAQDLIRAHGLTDRVAARQVEPGVWPPDLAGACDFITTFLVLHEVAPQHKDAVIEQCALALRPGGQLLIFDEQYPAGPAELRDPLLIFGVMAQWYELTWGNVVNTQGEIRDFLARQHLAIVHEQAISRYHVVVAEKPANPA